MPQKRKISKEDILSAAFGLAREGGPGALGARALATRLGTSTQPVFSHFASMKGLEAETLKAVEAFYEKRIAAALATAGKPYRAAGLAYIAFAREEPHLFRWLFMRDRAGEAGPDTGEIAPILALLQEQHGFSREDAVCFHAEMWIVVHGIATMIATGYRVWDEATVTRFLTDFYDGLCRRYGKEL